MKKLLIAILIISVFSIHLVSLFKSSSKLKSIKVRVAKEAKKSLRALFMGVFAIGLIGLAIIKFSFVRKVGFALIPEETTLIIRSILKAILGTESVYAALGILMCYGMLFLQSSLLFAVIGFFVVKNLLPIYIFEEESFFLSVLNASEIKEQPTLPYVNSKIFYSFARLRN